MQTIRRIIKLKSWLPLSLAITGIGWLLTLRSYEPYGPDIKMLCYYNQSYTSIMQLSEPPQLVGHALITYKSCRFCLKQPSAPPLDPYGYVCRIHQPKIFGISANQGEICDAETECFDVYVLLMILIGVAGVTTTIVVWYKKLHKRTQSVNVPLVKV